MPIVDCVYDRGQFFLPMSVSGSAPHYFIVDTGAGVSALEETLATELGLLKVTQTELAGTAGVLTVDRVRVDRILPLYRNRGVDELAWYGLTPTKQDLSGFQVPLPNTREAGLLGNDYLQSFVVQLRFWPPIVEITRPSGFAPAGADPQRFLPFFLDDAGILRIEGTLDGWLKAQLRFDTGSASMTVDGPYLNVTFNMWQALRDRHPEYVIEDTLKATGIGGEVHLDVARISSFEVGPLRFNTPRVVIQPPLGYFARADAVGFIALNLFESGGWLTFDYPNGRLYL